MKVLFASTKDQEEKIIESIDYLYREILPRYYDDEKITEFKKMGVLAFGEHHLENLGTLKEAYQVIASLQTISVILEQKIYQSLGKHYEEIFERNVAILKQFNISFPFHFSQFDYTKKLTIESFSMFKRAANEMLI